MAAAAASLRTFTDSISEGSTESNEPPITPSIIMRGSAFAPKVLNPLSLKVNPSFGLLPTRATLRPATLPCSNCVGSFILPPLKSSELIVAIALVISSFFWVPYPTITTSSSILSDCNCTVILS